MAVGRMRKAGWMACLAVVAALLCLAAAGCSGAGGAAAVAQRAPITTADGVTVAEMQGPGDSARAYRLGRAMSPLVGSCYTQGAPAGIEQLYEGDLLAGRAVQLTVDSRTQAAAFDALGGDTGSVVVLDPSTGAVLAMASTPSYDPAAASTSDGMELANRATELHIPGSTFKTVTLAAALERGGMALDTMVPAPAELTFAGGSITNYGVMQYTDQTLLEAYAKSINTVFAQVALTAGFDSVCAMAGDFGFDQDLMPDFELRPSTVCGAGEMSARMKAWSGVGQALYQADGELQGPVMSPVQGAVMAAAVANGGTVYAPHVVASVGGERTQADQDPRAVSSGFLSERTVEQLRAAMLAVVEVGTGASARVSGVDVRGKTGTAETKTGADDGWFIGYATKDGTCIAFAVLVEGAESSEAARVASRLVDAVYR